MTIIRLIACLSAFLACRVAIGATLTISQDLLIDAAQSFPDDNLRIVDGAVGPTHVTLVAGGRVGGGSSTSGHVDVLENSRLEMRGGYISDRLFLYDDASLIYYGGTIDSFGDANHVVIARGQSVLYVYLNDPFGPVALDDNSTGHFFGRDLQFVDGQIKGLTLSGALFELRVDVLSAGARVILHSIPEPLSGVSIGIALIAISPLLRRRRVTQRKFSFDRRESIAISSNIFRQ